ncbi:hypothetical protein VD0002_g10337 [Verticillium dahliae]|nr:hypothetical protein VD0003_g10294 [Verticillium dahliae]PNH49362.1 hypothetical protein VD0002_g10337 [Verticillium dahliae]
MVRDGLTKILTTQKHQNFVQLLNMQVRACGPSVNSVLDFGRLLD